MGIKLGNIVTKTKVETMLEFNIVENIDDIDPNIPTLVIGYEHMLEYYPDTSIIQRIYKNNLHWTFNGKENKREYIRDIEIFTQHCLLQLISVVNYVPIDTIHITKSTFKKIYRKIINSKKMCSFLYQNRIIYLCIDTIIFGVDLELYNFLGLDPEKIKNKIKCLPNNTFLNSEILIQYKEYIERLDDNIKYLPYLYSINNGEGNINSDIHKSI